MTRNRGAAVRARAARVLNQVIEGSTLEAALDSDARDQDSAGDPRDRALLRELTAGSLRFFPRLDGVLGAMLSKPMRRRDAELRSLAIVGLYQLDYTRIPAHAAVSATVDASALLGRGQARSLLNALLRRYQRERAELEARLNPAAAHAQPAWLWSALGDQWADDRSAIAAASNERPPMTLRVNATRIDRAGYLALLRDAGIEASPGARCATAVTLVDAMDVAAIPGFDEGLCSVQDETAQLAASCLELAPRARVLDACAAPGGKACHLLEAHPGIELTAMDISAERLAAVGENLRRLSLQAELVEGDASTPPPSLENGGFSAIVVDAPCSASGVVRRHPDIKLLRRAADIAGFAAQQRAILSGLWPLLAPGGQLLYVTCSILGEENSHTVRAFLAATADATEEPLSLPGGRACRHGVQILPSTGGGDGLFFARLRKGGDA
ncbi:MAG: 16S rRNA (cytosine(967)-C(5))-methyltransferase RsmB [Halieaceae bacterium]|jgi:16S rRNA (cytosine967-C5)-methyltransferase|nr:16S rRNA (cytosine(967)-C(5))-methyltransferase RsmB [Halieaceae bacterium]